jgi:drug/metabolite transporter (DMT)-like permease
VFAILLAAVSALIWGTADYAGGRASRRLPALRVAVLSKVLSLPALALYLVLTPTRPVLAAALWGAAAGMVGLVALVIFYGTLSGGAMSVVAPVSAVTTAVLPFTVGLLAGDRPGTVAIVGVACAVLAIALVSLTPDREDGGSEQVAGGGSEQAAGGGSDRAAGSVTAARRRVTPLLVGRAMAAGVGFGLFFVLLNFGNEAAGGDAGLWPVAAAQMGALAIGGVLLAGSSRTGAGGPVPLRGALLGWLVAVGVLDMTANVLYLVAVRDGLLSIVAPVAALYPVSTVLLALALDRERVRPVQVAGLGLAVAALVLIAS